MKIKASLLSVLRQINLKNFDKGMSEFNKSMKQFGNAMDSMNDDLSDDIEESKKRAKFEEEKNKKNLDKIWGKSDVKIWSDKKTEL